MLHLCSVVCLQEVFSVGQAFELFKEKASLPGVNQLYTDRYRLE